MFLENFADQVTQIVGAYLLLPASACAANVFKRSLFEAIFPLFATYMLNGQLIHKVLCLTRKSYMI